MALSSPYPPPWLSAFVKEKIRELGASHPHLATVMARQGGLTLHGSPGIEVIVKPDGSVWVQEYELAPGATHEPWREASENERIAAYVLASRRIPEFHALVPERPASARICRPCEGTGFLFTGAVICKHCGALGWLAEDAT